MLGTHERAASEKNMHLVVLLYIIIEVENAFLEDKSTEYNNNHTPETNVNTAKHNINYSYFLLLSGMPQPNIIILL